MYRFNTFPLVLILGLALVFAACQQSGEYGEEAGEHEEAMEDAGSMEMAQPVTVSGLLLVDTKCYGMNHANTGNDHMMPDGSTVPNCATACANMGIPVALLEGTEADATLHTLITPSTGLADHMAHEARITGMPAFDNGLIPNKIEVKDDAGNWVEVAVATMM